MLLSHLPASTPRMLSRVMTVSQKTAKTDKVKRTGGERLCAGAEGKERGGRAEVKHAGEEGQIAHPVGPGGDEAGEIAEGLAGPDVEAAFFGMARGELHDAGREGNEEADERGDPDDQDAGAGGGGGGRPAHAEDDDHVEERPDRETGCLA